MNTDLERELRKQGREDAVLLLISAVVFFILGVIAAALVGALA